MQALVAKSPLWEEPEDRRMTRSAEAAAREAKIAELKRLITAGKYETLEMLEDAVDALLWREQDRLQEHQNGAMRELARSHPK
jgi:hypothetical protein